MDGKEAPDFEWMARVFVDEDGDRITRHYLIDPAGQLRGEVDEPCSGRLAYLADAYDEAGRTGWVHLGLAKAHCETHYLDSLKGKKVTKRKR